MSGGTSKGAMRTIASALKSSGGSRFYAKGTSEARATRRRASRIEAKQNRRARRNLA